MTILGIDPGSTMTAYVVLGEHGIETHCKVGNEEMLRIIRFDGLSLPGHAVVVIEQIRGYGIRAGNELFDTVHWGGRFEEAACRRNHVVMLPRKTIVTHLCGHGQAGDKHVRDAIIDRYGGQERALGTVSKKLKINEPGPLWGIAGDEWAALACALTFMDRAEMGL